MSRSLWCNTPQVGINLHFLNIFGILVSFISSSCRFGNGLLLVGRIRRRGSWWGLRARKSKLFLGDGIGNLCSLAKEIKVLSYRLLSSGTSRGTSPSSAKSIIVQGIVRLVQLVTKTVVGILEVESVNVLDSE